ncbi:hypothetical protein [Mesorhizobium sp. B2-3-10]|uniref:hypothetical protein n=1 Tax=Mesorhizobium sp. B2-3-10 TaxID=2589954 RepID=UPI001126A73E|nr:hypothetical protein [Mesorhizobium sp. B2-3-10]TPL98325.1 hypothetical protein FJ943_15585 [Mesorhizobium sp. B2-3-10]
MPLASPELASLTSLAKLVGGDNLPTGALQTAAEAPNLLDAQAKRYQGISDQFKEGQLTPLTAIIKGVTGQVAASKSEKAQAQRDAKQAKLDELLQWKANNEKHQAEVQQMLAAHQEASLTGNQLAQSIDQLATGDESGVRNWLASNPETAKMMSQRLGAPVESATFTKLNGVDTLIPYGRDAQGNTVTGEAIPVDTLLKGYAPEAYQARYATRQEQALNDAKIKTETAQGNYYDAQAGAKTNPPAKPIPPTAAKMQGETLQIIGSLGQTNDNIDKILADINSGQLKTDLVNRTVSGAANFTGNSTPQSRALATYQSNVKKMVNDSLLLAKGVQTEGDAQRAAAAIMAAPFDTAAVAERLAELRQINSRSADLHKAANDQMRSEYGHDPMDYSAYEPRTKAPAAAAPAEAAPTYARNLKTGERLMLQGGQWVPAK